MKKTTITKSIIIFVCLVFCASVGCMGCATGKGLLLEIPTAEFESFEYHRAGNMTSMDISARNSKLDGDSISIEEVSIKADYGPTVNFNLSLKGYKRKISDFVKEQITQNTQD